MQIINPEGLARPIGYSHGIKATGTFLAIAGQVGWDASGKVVGPGFVEQFAQALENILAVARAAGGGPEDIVRMTIFVTDKQEYLSSVKPLGQAYRRLMGRHFPAMTCVEVRGLVEEGAKLEIEATAVLRGD